jgi:glucosamine kinase
MTQASDGRAPATSITNATLSRLRLADLPALHTYIYQQVSSRAEIARLATIVAEEAKKGDAVARQIMAVAAHELAKGVCSVLRRLDMIQTPARVTGVGGVFRAGSVLIKPFMQRIHADAPLAEYAPARFPPVVGSLLLALRALGVPLSATILENIATTLTPFQEMIH